MSATRWCGVALGIAMASALTVAACSTRNAVSGPTSGPGASGSGDGTGHLSMRISLPDGESIDSVAYTLTNSSTTVQSGTLSTANSQSIAFGLGAVPAGSGYTLALTATTGTGTQCVGTAGPFAVQAHSTVLENVTLVCSTNASDGGNIFIGIGLSYCATWQSLATIPPDGDNGSEAFVGSDIILTAAATGADPAHLTYSWSQSNAIGSFGINQANGTSDQIHFTCLTPGSTTITLVVGDGPLPDGSVCPATLTTVTANVRCDTPFCMSATTCPPGADNACLTRTCTQSSCGTILAPAGTVTPTQTAGDCHTNQCDGSGNIVSVQDDTDLPTTSNQCVTPTCVAGVPGSTPKPQRTACGTSGMFCDGNGSCVGCLTAADCGAASACTTVACVANQCVQSALAEGTGCGAGQICNGVGSCVPFTVSVARIGNGGSLAPATAPVFIEQRLVSDGSLVSTTALPTATPDAGSVGPLTVALTDTGTAVTDGELSRSVDGRFLAISGYATGPGQVVTGGSGPTIPRVVGVIDSSQNVDTSTIFNTTAFNGQPVRGVASVDGSAFWVAGASPAGGTQGGIWFISRGASGGGVQLNTGSMRTMGIYGGQLYGDGDTTMTPEIFAIGAGLPTSGSPAIAELTGMPTIVGPSPWAFVLLDLFPPAGVDTLYIANDRATGGGTATNGIQKWVLSGTTWTQSVMFNEPAVDGGAGVGFRGLTALITGSVVTLVATTADTGVTQNRLVVYVDNGSSDAGATAGTVIATSAANTLFRGVALSPHN